MLTATQYLTERVVSRTENFQIGFEMEAIVDPSAVRTISPETKSSSKLRKPLKIPGGRFTGRVPTDQERENLLYLMRMFPGGNAIADASIRTNHKDDFPFEFVSSVLPFNDEIVDRLYKTLAKIVTNGVYTNSSCGFHIHFSHPGFSRFDLLWIKLNFLVDKQAQDTFLTFKSSQGDIEFWSKKYANPGDIEKLASEFVELLKSHDPSSTKYVKKFNAFFEKPYFSSKYTVLGIHDKYRTLEWRGPRGFLDTKNLRDLKKFLAVFKKMVAWLSKANNRSSIVIGGRRLNRDTFESLFTKIASPRQSQFAVDILDQLADAENEQARADLLASYFQHFSNAELTANHGIVHRALGSENASRHATNARKVFNAAKHRYPTAVKLFLSTVRKKSPSFVKWFHNTVISGPEV